MAKVTQLTAWVENASGELGRIAQALDHAKVDITAFTAYGTGVSCPIRLQVSNQAKAREVLLGLGIRVTEEEVLRVTLAAKPGLLQNLATRLGEADINVEYAYAAAPRSKRTMDMVLSVSDVAGACKILDQVLSGA
ncbi:MAG TPA: amino acid-binding protein [Terriglobia bacterium]|nr:amino acid-binding protein [Terriglobia bacterium]